MKPIQAKGHLDLPSLCKPINTSVSELYQVSELLQDGTDEDKFLLSYECNVIYECRSCQNFFRSIVDFLSHKRKYCTKKIDVINHKCISNNYNHSASESIIHETEQTSNDVKNDRIHRNQVYKQSNETDFSGIIDLLNKKQKEMVKQLRNKNKISNVPDDRHIYLITELQNITDQNVIVGKEQMPENQLKKSHSPIQVNMGDEENELRLSMNDLSCSLCNAKFSTNETLLVHVKTLHTSKRLCYSCPCCSHVFTNSWSVYRHLCKGHKKTLKQIHKLKSQIEKKAFYREIVIERNSVDNNNDSNIILPEESDNSILLSPTENQFVSNENLKSPAIVRTNMNKVSFAASKMKDKKKKASSLYSEKQLINSKERDKIKVKEDNSKLQSSRSTRPNQKNSKSWKWKKWTLLKDKIAIMADYRKLRCLLCQYKFSSIPYLRRHIAMHIGWYRYCCKLCNFKCFIKCDCDVHCSTVHNMQKSSTVLAEMVLEKSQDEYTYKGNLKLPSIVCTDTFSFAASKMKNKKKKTSSPYNEKQLIDLKERDKIEVEEDNSNLQSSRSTQPNQKNSKNRKWKNWTLLENKIAAVADYRKLRCLLCQHKFSSIANLRRHIVMHIDWYRYSRKLCNFKCFVKCDCVAHCSKVHNMQNSTVLVEMVLEKLQNESIYREDTSANITDPKTKSDNPDFMDIDMVDVTTSLCQLETHVNSNDSIDLDGCVTLQNEIIAANIRARELCKSTKCQNVYAGDSDKTVKMQDPSTECTMNCKKLNNILKWMVMEVILGPTNTSLIRVRTDFDKPVLETRDSTGKLMEVNGNVNNAETIDESK